MRKVMLPLVLGVVLLASGCAAKSSAPGQVATQPSGIAASTGSRYLTMFQGSDQSLRTETWYCRRGRISGAGAGGGNWSEAIRGGKC